MAVIFALQFTDRSLGPILPLFLAASGVQLARVPLTSGLLFSVAAGTGAAGNTMCPRLLKRWSARQLIAVSTTIAAASALLLATRPSLTMIFAATTAFGSAIGVATTAVYTAAGSTLPDDVRGAGFGLFASASLSGLAISPMVAGFLGALDIRAVFVADAIVMACVTYAVRRTVQQAAREPSHVGTGQPLE
jgi:MFS family permease